MDSEAVRALNSTGLALREVLGMTTNSARVAVLAVAAALVVSGCATIKITAPAADSVVMLPSNTAPTPVSLTSSSNIANLVVTADGNNVTNQVTYSSATGDYTGAFGLTPSQWHTVVASGDVYCSYCTGQQYHATATTNFCVAAPPNPAEPPLKIAFAQGDNQSWAPSGAHAAAVAMDTGATATRWRLRPIGTGLYVAYATLQSAQFPCSCLRSVDNANGTAIQLAACDASDQRQQWLGEQEQMSSGKGFYRLTNRAVADSGANWGCIAEGSGGSLVQSNCSDSADRLWAIFDTSLNSFVAGSPGGTPW
jgi:hypothetical protein